MDEEKKSEASGAEVEQVGPYQLREQVAQDEHSRGELYRATHETSGATALVVRPSPEEGAEVLDALPSHFLINIEFKCDHFDHLGPSQKVAQLVTRQGLAERVVISSFNLLCLFRTAAAAPSLRRGYLIDPDKRWGPQAYLLNPLVSSHSVHPYFEQCTPERVEEWRQKGLRVAVWTVDEPERARRLEEMGVSYLITNKLRVLREALRGKAA